MSTKSTLVYTILLFILGISGCTEPRNGGIPTYITVNEILFDGSPFRSNTHSIKDIAIQINGKNYGQFELPFTIPVFEEGQHDLVLSAGVFANGSSDNRILYPYIEQSVSTETFLGKDTIEVTPNFTYFNTLNNNLFDEAFETNSVFEDFEVTTNRDEVIAGSGSGKLVLNADNDFVEANSINTFELDLTTGSYLELDYKSDAVLFIGLVAIYGSNESAVNHLVLAPRTLANRAYIELTDLHFRLQADKYRVRIVCGLPSDTDQSTVIIDNVRVLQF